MEKKDSGRAVPGRGKAPGPRVRDWECGCGGHCAGAGGSGKRAVGKDGSAGLGRAEGDSWRELVMPVLD